MRPLAEGRRVGSDDSDPDGFRALDLGPVALPFDRSIASAVICRHDHRRLAAVLRARLQLVPEPLEICVGGMGGPEIAIVAAAVGLLVCVAQADVEHPRGIAPEMLQGDLKGKRVIPAVFPGLRRLGHQPIQKDLAFGQCGAFERHPARVDEQAAALDVQDERVDVPRPDCADSSAKSRPAIQPLEDRRIGIGPLVIAVDPRVRRAGEHLVVAGIGEVHAVGDLGRARLVGVAVELPAMRHDRPEERHQRLAPGLRRLAPELAADRLDIGDAPVGLVQECRVGSSENLLPTQAIGRDQDDIAGTRSQLETSREGCESQPRR